MAEGPPVGNQTRTAATVDIRGTSGRLDFAWLAAPTTATSKIVLTEDTQDPVHKDYHFVSVACTNGSTPITVPQAPTVTLDGLSVHDDITCTFKNRKDQGQITIAKRFIGTPTQVSLSLDGTVRKTSSQATFDTGSLPASIGRHTVSEQFSNDAIAALYDSSYRCATAAGSTVASGSGTVVANGVDIADGDDITCTFTNRKELSGQVSKSADPDVLPEPGGQVKFSVTVVNTSRGPVTVSSLQDDVFGNLDANSPDSSHKWISSACLAGASLAGYDGAIGGADTYTCTFTGVVSGTPDDPHKDTVTIRLEDASGESIDRTASATVAIRDVLPAISVTKLADPEYVQDSGTVTYTAVVTNTSVADTLMIDTLSDSVYGDLLTGPVRATCLYGDSPVTFPYRLPAGESLRCSFTVTVTGTTTDTLTASGTDDEGNRATDAAGAIVTVGITPPPLPAPLPPDPEAAGTPTIALAVDKQAPATAYRGADATTFAYDVRVSNAGPDPAPQTMLHDPAPSGGRFGKIVHQPAQGHCDVQQNGALLVCDLGTVQGGQTLSVRLPLTLPPTVKGPVTNTATASCTPTPATAACKAHGAATTKLLAPLKPAASCPAVSLAPSAFRANETQQVTVSVRPAARTSVALRGPGVHVDVHTSAAGKATATVTPTSAGTLTASTGGASRCNATSFPILSAVEPAFTG